MSAVSTEPRLASGLPTLPRVNLLPPEIEERRRFRQVQYGLGLAVALAVVIVVVLYAAAAHSVSSAKSDLATATATKSSLTSQVAQFGNVTAVRDQCEASQAMLVSAMGQEVRYSHLLSDLSLSIPDNVWLTSLAYTQGTAAAPAVGAATSVPAIGTFTVSAVGFNHDEVAVWLDAVASQPNYLNPDFGSSAEGLLGTRKVVSFSSTASIAPAALSQRFATPGTC